MKLPWIYVAKGLAIFLVVLGHARSKVFAGLEGSPRVVEAWSVLGEILPVLRMPLFFAVSGMLAANAVVRPWKMVVHSRILGVYWVYVIWLAIGAILFTYFPGFDTSIPRTVGRFVSELLLGTSYLWYLYALIVFFVVVKLLYPFKYVICTLGLTCSLLISAQILPHEVHGNLLSMGRSFFFFALGVYARRAIVSLVESRTIATGFCGLTVGVALLVTANIYEFLWVIPLASVSLLMAMLCGCKLICGVVPRVVEYMGKQTLPIYVMHMPLLAGIHAIIPLWSPYLNELLFVLAPLLLAGSAIAICLMLHKILMRIGMRFLFELPTNSRSLAAVGVPFGSRVQMNQVGSKFMGARQKR